MHYDHQYFSHDISLNNEEMKLKERESLFYIEFKMNSFTIVTNSTQNVYN